MFYIIATIIISVVSVICVIAIILQEGKSAGLGAISGSGAQNDTYWSRNKGRSKEGRLERITTVCGIVFLVVAVLLNVSAFL